MTQICIERERDKRNEKEKEKENKGDINTSIHTVRLYLWTYSPDFFEQNKIKSSFYTIIELLVHSASTYYTGNSRKLMVSDRNREFRSAGRAVFGPYLYEASLKSYLVEWTSGVRRVA
jgi:hypothetical protein